ncbi:hypothetical protein GQ53DRAFT_847705 [Thozetella sp. PMI_491]|nr:hypothetical protein GQ53DRAFT_847705 [Thozetella sp. PMI_491]
MQYRSLLAGLVLSLLTLALAQDAAQPTGVRLSRRQRCGWQDDCENECESNYDCDDGQICRRGECVSARTSTRPSRPRPTDTCEWTGHCAGDRCNDENDCDGNMICRSGRCASPNGGGGRGGGGGGGNDGGGGGDGDGEPTSTDPDGPAPTAGGCGAANIAACLGNPCSTNADCGGGLVLCKDGICAL